MANVRKSEGTEYKYCKEKLIRGCRRKDKEEQILALISGKR